MSLFNRKTELLPLTELCLGELNYSVPGAYDNVRHFPLEVKANRNVYVEVETSQPIDISIIDTKGYNTKFKENFEGGVFGPVPTKEKGTMAVFLGIYRGEKSDVKIRAWME